MLEVRDVSVEFRSHQASLRALDRVSLTVGPGETVAVVGESGCGKTTLARSILGLQRTIGGDIELDGVQVKGVSRGQAERVGMIWQDPYASLDPKWQIGRCVAEPAKLAGKQVDVESIMAQVGLEPRFASRYPHQLSGGQRQRVAIARALALKPQLVICDEPTAALDLSIQAQILNLLKDLQQELHCSYLYISHDLVTVRFLADRVAVMYRGQIVEEGPTESVFANPTHPYTRLLLDSAPTLESIGKLPEAEGREMSKEPVLTGCLFADRCAFVQDKCRQEAPQLQAIGEVSSRCWFPLGKRVSS